MNSILITGGAGSFGRAFVRHILANPDCPERVCILSRDELKHHSMAQEFNDPRLRFFLGDVRDQRRLELAFAGVEMIIHAAALKHVPAGEYDPLEFLKTNTMGSANVLAAARSAGVKKVLLLSTDKAPASCTSYGATKFCAERLFIAANSYHGPISACTRYGNILGSSGSVIPTWRAMVAAGKQAAVTDPNATRFCMTQQQAVQLVLLALREMRGGEVFIPKLRSYRIGDLCQVATGERGVVIGLRPAEKMHECLVAQDEMRQARDFGDHIRLIPEIHPWRGDENVGGLPLEGEQYSSRDAVMSLEELWDVVSETSGGLTRGSNARN